MPQGYSQTKYMINYKKGENRLKGKSGEDEVRRENSIDKIHWEELISLLGVAPKFNSKLSSSK